jgi:DNA-binding NarL/FixJ family response regulator
LFDSAIKLRGDIGMHDVHPDHFQYAGQKVISFPAARKKILVICRESFVREAIEAALDQSGLVSAYGASSLGCLGEQRHEYGAILYIEAAEGESMSGHDGAFPEYLCEQNWVVMSRNGEGHFLAGLVARGANVSIIPFDVATEDIAHFALLAANRRRVLVDSFCQIEGATERAAIRSAGLTEDQVRLMQFLSEGYSNKAIALLEQTAENTIKMRVRALLAKLDVTNRTQAAVIAARAGMRFDQPESPAARRSPSPEHA